MTRTLIFASGNPHKLSEIRYAAAPEFEILSPSEAGYHLYEPNETENSLEGNALLKAHAFHASTGENCFAEDTGLEVEELDGAPGIFTARYAGPENNAIKNIQKLLRELQFAEHRKARFRAVIALIFNGTPYVFEGTVQGSIAEVPRGSGGFGYDPVFIPDGYENTFAELPPAIKNTLSHRAQAVHKMLEFLKAQRHR